MTRKNLRNNHVKVRKSEELRSIVERRVGQYEAVKTLARTVVDHTREVPKWEEDEDCTVVCSFRKVDEQIGEAREEV